MSALIINTMTNEVQNMGISVECVHKVKNRPDHASVIDLHSRGRVKSLFNIGDIRFEIEKI